MLIGNHIDIRQLQPSELDTWLAQKNAAVLASQYCAGLLENHAVIHREFSEHGLLTEAMETLAIVSKFNKLIGTLCHYSPAGYSTAREIGITLFSNEQMNKGVATEAVGLLAGYLFANRPINRLQMVMPTEHAACEKVALKCGFKKEGIARGLIFMRGRYVDCCVYALLRSEFELAADN
jgi:[ribosomal protein S5]-alanine N-acetyltransferase